MSHSRSANEVRVLFTPAGRMELLRKSARAKMSISEYIRTKVGVDVGVFPDKKSKSSKRFVGAIGAGE